jgi:hypothetical protein
MSGQGRGHGEEVLFVSHPTTVHKLEQSGTHLNLSLLRVHHSVKISVFSALEPRSPRSMLCATSLASRCSWRAL